LLVVVRVCVCVIKHTHTHTQPYKILKAFTYRLRIKGEQIQQITEMKC